MPLRKSLLHMTYLFITLSLFGSCLSFLDQKVRIAHIYGKRDKQDHTVPSLRSFLGSLGQRLDNNLGESKHQNRRTGSDLDEPYFAHILGRDLEDLHSHYPEEYNLDQNSDLVLENKPDHTDIYDLINETRDHSNENNKIPLTEKVGMPVFSAKTMAASAAKKHIRKTYLHISH